MWQFPVPWVTPQYVEPDEPGGFVSFKIWRFPEKLVPDATRLLTAIRAYKWMVDPEGEDRGLPCGDIPQHPGIDSETTVFEAVTPLIPAIVAGEINVRKTISDAFDRCLESLEKLYRAYIVAETDWRVRALTRRAIEPIIPWTTSDPLEEEFGGLGFFEVNYGDADPVVPVGTMEADRLERMNAILERQGRVGKFGDPATTMVEHLRHAQYAYNVEFDYSSCVVWTYSSAETMFDGMLLMMAWEEDLDFAEAAKWYDMSLAKRVASLYHLRLGGQWNLKVSDTPLGAWRRAILDVRHRVIHDSYNAAEGEAGAALRARERVRDYVFDRLARKRRIYPKTALIWLTIPGLKRRHVYDRFMKTVVERAGEEEYWLESYRDYVNEVRSLWRFES